MSFGRDISPRPIESILLLAAGQYPSRTPTRSFRRGKYS